MSRLLGTPEDRWSLAQAVDALIRAARAAGRPCWLWLAGVVYPSLSVSVGLLVFLISVGGQTVDFELSSDMARGNLFGHFLPGVVQINIDGMSWFGEFLLVCVALLATVPLLRLNCGLARLVDPGPDGTGRPAPNARTIKCAWAAGKGLGFVACGMSILMNIFIGLAFAILIGPVVATLDFLELPDWLMGNSGLLLVPFLSMVWAYAVVLQVIHQLALMSLVHNRRGILSAVTHGWRLVRASPWAAVRALIVDLLLFTVQLVGIFVLGSLLPTSARVFLILAALGFFGLTRASYWASVYRALGGASTAPEPAVMSASPTTA